jgi:hypothetical protein
MIKGAGNEQGNPVTSVNAGQAPGTVSLHAVLRRIIATTEDPDAAAHRCDVAVTEWLRSGAASVFADAIRSATDDVIAERLPRLEAVIRADERQRCVDFLRAEAARMDAEAAVPGELRAHLLAEDAASLSIAANLLTVRMHGLAQGPAENGGSKEMAGD